MKLFTFLFAILFVVVRGGNNDYLEGSKVYNVRLHTKEDHLVISNIIDEIPDIDIWEYSHISDRPAKIFVAKEYLNKFESMLQRENIQYDIMMDDPKSTIEAEIKQQELARMNKEMGKISFDYYNSHDEINEYLRELAKKYPEKVIVETLGKTENYRKIKVIKISSNGGNDPNKPIIVSEAGIHAREWIAPATALYMITKLVEDITESDVADKVDWFIIPVINPDGYEYTHTAERLWRKNRSIVTSTKCPGVDVNRNFGYKWSNSEELGDACSENFSGPSGFSEIESQVLRNLIEANKNRVKAYLAIHSAGSYILYPYGHDDSKPPNVDELKRLGNKMSSAIDALAAPGSKKYTVGSVYEKLHYLAPGGSMDWVMGVGNVSLSYTIELPKGEKLFELHPSKIKQVVKETWAGVLVFARYVIEKYTQ